MSARRAHKPSVGYFLTLEGVDGAGKSTYAHLIADKLKSLGFEVIQTREPGGTELGEQIRQRLLSDQPLMPLAELLMFFAARSEHVERVIAPALKSGQAVVCERFIDSSYAYQGGGRSLPLDWIAHLEAMLGAPEPDLTLFFDLCPTVALERKRAHSEKGDRFEEETIDFYRRVRAIYQQRAEDKPQRIKTISTDSDPASVYRQIEAVLDQFLPTLTPSS